MLGPKYCTDECHNISVSWSSIFWLDKLYSSGCMQPPLGCTNCIWIYTASMEVKGSWSVSSHLHLENAVGNYYGKGRSWDPDPFPPVETVNSGPISVIYLTSLGYKTIRHWHMMFLVSFDMMIAIGRKFDKPLFPQYNFSILPSQAPLLSSGTSGWVWYLQRCRRKYLGN